MQYNKESLINFFTTDNLNGNKFKEVVLKKLNMTLYNDIIYFCDNNSNLKNLNLKAKIYHYVYNEVNIPKCLHCGKELMFFKFSRPYLTYCSHYCSDNDINSNKKKKDSYNQNDMRKISEKRNKTIIEKYGSIENYNKKLLDNNIKKCMSKHGCKYYFQSAEFKINRKKKLKEKYQNENFNNQEKAKETRIKNGDQIDDTKIKEFLDYKKTIINKTNINYKIYKNIINPKNLKRGTKFYHIDHIYSIKQGFLNNVPIDIINHPANLKMIWCVDNIKKQDGCDITLEELYSKIKSFNHH